MFEYQGVIASHRRLEPGGTMSLLHQTYAFRLLIRGTVIFGILAAGTTSYARNVFGTEDRIQVHSSALPWSAIGRLTTANGFCTATLVAANLVLTSAHCLYDKKINT